MFKKTNASSNGIIRRSEMIKRPSQDLASGRSYLPAIASTPLVDRMSPRPFSPFYEESNLNLPRERMDVNAWARHYYDTDPLIGNCIDLHSTYPLSSFGVRCPESMEVEQFFNRMLERLNFKTLIYDIAREYFIVGEVFPYCQLDEDTGEWSEIIVQNPDFIDVRKHILTSPVISLKPDAELQRIITSSDPDSLALRSQLDPELIAYIQSGKNIPLENHLISHIARKSAPYQVRGTSILTRVYKDLMLRDIYREAQFCYQDGTQVLTDRGFIDFKELKLEDKIATTPLESGELQYRKPKAIHSFDYNGDMYHFKTRQVDCAVTPNHRMVVQDTMGEWKISRADQVKESYKFRASHTGWNEGIEAEDIDFAGEKVIATQLMEFLGYWLSDGSISRASRGYTVNIAQAQSSKCYEKIKNCLAKMPYSFNEYSSQKSTQVVNGDTIYNYSIQMSDFNFNNKALYSALEQDFGKGAFNKYIPQWILEYSPRLLRILLDALVAGDGNTRTRKSHKKYITYSSVSKKLADNVQEIAFKCGFSPSISTWISREGSTVYSVKWSDRKIDTYGIKNDKRYPNNNSISTYHYEGKVWCPEVENGIFVTRWNGKISIQGNTIAANHVTPLRIVKVGAADGSYRPGTDELLAVRDMLEQATYDTNFTIITHTGFDLTYVGANGQMLDLGQEFEHIEDRILTGLFTSKAFTHGEGPCNSSDTETLTKDGWKFYDDITDKDEIATINPNTGNLEFNHYTGRVKFDVDCDLMHFENGSIDHKVSINHDVWVKKTGKDKSYSKMRADAVKSGYGFKSHMGWEGKKASFMQVGSKKIPINDYMLIAGLYLSEGSINFWNGKENGVAISQVKNHKSGINERYNIIKDILERNYSVKEKLASRREPIEYAAVADVNSTSEGFYIADKDLATHLLKTYGHGSAIKSIPSKIKEYSKEILQSLLDGCNLGDGSKLNNHTESYEIFTVSKKMADDLQEIALKCGYASIIKERKRSAPRQLLYRVRIYLKNIKKKMYEPQVRTKDIKRVPYKGWIYCFEVPNHLFVVRRNGKVVITGNTYANASVALEVLQQRYVSFRNIIERWLERKVFAPISRIQDFTYYRNGIKQLIIPKVDWQKINLKNNREYQQALEGLVRDNKASLETLHEALDLDHQKEKKRILSEIDFQKEVAYKLQTPYMGKENINVSSPNKEDMGTPAAPAPGGEGGPGGAPGGGGPAGGGGDLGGGAPGGEPGGEAGGGLDLGGGGAGMDLGGGPPAAGASGGV